MGTKKFKPTSPAVRSMVVADFEEITAIEPCKSLVVKKAKNSGRNNMGRVTVRHRGGGVRKAYRLIDFKRDKDDVPARVASIEYDPNRTARIALLNYADGEKRYIIAPIGLKVDDTVASGVNAEIKTGNSLPLKNIPTGTTVHNIELIAGKGAQIARSAGASAQLMAKDKGYAVIKLASGEQRLVREECRATIGQVGNIEHRNIKIGKAGRKRLMGRRPQVRGSVMNPCDHPHGGGEGRAPIGRSHPCTPAGKPALGMKTRKKNKASNRLIISKKKK